MLLNTHYLIMNEAGVADGGGAASDATPEAAPEEAIVDESTDDGGEGYVDSSDAGLEDASASAEDEAEAAAEVIQEAIDEGASEEQVQQMIETFKLKINGQEKEVTLDWNDKEDIVRRLQMAEAAPLAMQRAAEAEKGAQSLKQRLKEDLWGLAQEEGLDPDELAEMRIQQQIEELQKSPEQRAQEQRDRELEQLRQKLKAQEEEAQRIKHEQQVREAEADLQNEISEAISATSQLPNTKFVKDRVIEAMAWFMDQKDESGNPKYNDVKAKDVVPIVEKEIQKNLDELYDNMSDDVLEKFFSKKLQDRLRAKRLKNAPKTVKAPDTGLRNKPKEPTEEAKVSMRDFLKKGFSK